ncbi:hypothetical protein [Andreprevotia lacus]|uniref:hypothetical protein n=1 Tax=Andreprevotia lacus TaxID=1121000 RepID=UPI00111C58DC|nr:hypothetical protein [Andreprevotia lacus]
MRAFGVMAGAHQAASFIPATQAALLLHKVTPLAQECAATRTSCGQTNIGRAHARPASIRPHDMHQPRMATSAPCLFFNNLHDQLLIFDHQQRQMASQKNRAKSVKNIINSMN